MELFWLSPLLTAVAQAGSILYFLIKKEAETLSRRSYFITMIIGFSLFHVIFQVILHTCFYRENWGSLPTLPYLALMLGYYFLYVLAAARLSATASLFIALVFLLADNCSRLLISNLSCLIWGVSYLYRGSPARQLPCVLMWLIGRLLPPLHKIRLDRYNRILAYFCFLPFLVIQCYVGYLTTQSDKTLLLLIAVCSLAALITLIGGVGRTSGEYDRIRTARMHYVLRSQQQQFQQKLEDIDAVNRKYHDMKNILLYLEAYSGDHEAVSSAIETLRREIRPYETLIATGNEAIDILLGDKLAVCQEQQITCIPYLDGCLLDFVEPLDLCTLFGNALDNAIESCAQIPDAADRLISIKAVRRDNCTVLTFRNTFQTPPDLTHGLPRTTKADSENHGYGLRNIRYIMKKYDGEMNCRVEGREFVLTLLFMQ